MAVKTVSSKRLDLKRLINEVRKAKDLIILRTKTALVLDFLWKRVVYWVNESRNDTSLPSPAYKLVSGDYTLPKSSSFLAANINRFDVTNTENNPVNLTLNAGEVFIIGHETFTELSFCSGNATFRIYETGQFTLV